MVWTPPSYLEIEYETSGKSRLLRVCEMMARLREKRKKETHTHATRTRMYVSAMHHLAFGVYMYRRSGER